MEWNKYEQALLDALKAKRDKTLTIAELAASLPRNREAEDRTSRARNALRRPVKAGVVKQTARGTYTLMTGAKALINGKANGKVLRHRIDQENESTPSPRSVRKKLLPGLDGPQGDLADVVMGAILLGDTRRSTQIAMLTGFSRGKVIGQLKKAKLPKTLPKAGEVKAADLKKYIGAES